MTQFRKKYCRKGHPLTKSNRILDTKCKTIGCLPCRRATNKNDKTCINGHDLSIHGREYQGYLQCKECRRLKGIENRLKAGIKPRLKPNSTHCSRGHEFTPENTLVRKNGQRVCKDCTKILYKQYRKKKNPDYHPLDDPRCRNGHLRIPENTTLTKRGHRVCKICTANQTAKFRKGSTAPTEPKVSLAGWRVPVLAIYKDISEE